MRFFAVALGALSALSSLGVMAATNCIGTCMNDKRNQFGTYGCSDAGAAGCLCLSSNWLGDIKTCAATGCQATSDEVIAELKGNWCNSVPGFPVGEAAASPPASTPSAPPATSASPAASQPPPTTSTASQQTAQSTTSPAATESTPAASSPSSSAPVTSTSAPSSSASASPESTASSSTDASETQTSASPSGTSAAPASQTTSSDAAASPGLSKAAIAGIGVGVGAAAIAAIGIALCFILKNRRRQNIRHSMQISKPLPGSGRYPGGRRDNRPRGASFEKYANEIEMQSNRYEDMLPRQQPRTMV